MRIPKMSRVRARALYQSGITTAEQLSTASVSEVVTIFRSCTAWMSSKRKLIGEGPISKANFIEDKIAKSVIRRAGIHVETLKSDSKFSRQAEIELSQERRKARAEREAKKSKKAE